MERLWGSCDARHKPGWLRTAPSTSSGGLPGALEGQGGRALLGLHACVRAVLATPSAVDVAFNPAPDMRLCAFPGAGRADAVAPHPWQAERSTLPNPQGAQVVAATRAGRRNFWVRATLPSEMPARHDLCCDEPHAWTTRH